MKKNPQCQKTRPLILQILLMTPRSINSAAVAIYFLAPPIKPSPFPKSMKGTAPPVTCGRVPFHFLMLLYWTKMGLMERERRSFALAYPWATTWIDSASPFAVATFCWASISLCAKICLWVSTCCWATCLASMAPSYSGEKRMLAK